MSTTADQGCGDEEEAPAFHLTEKDRQNLLRSDSDFQPHTWDNLKRIIAANDLESLRRWPSDLKRYLKWTKETKERYGTITNYICKERLHWEPLLPVHPDDGPEFEVQSPEPFADERDYKILVNDWPYGLDPEITHIVVWLKNRLPTVPPEGDLTKEARRLIERFLQRTFIDRVGDEGDNKVMWFRNWTGLQSVRGMDHIHVLVRDVSQDIVDEWTGGRTPLP
ncbi:MAG: hypothetical protein L6R39_004681 [Caloplaca ligustica]|nr:MAG: hypothetical protein L6R39_004681 [Caloplaca ligustica]